MKHDILYQGVANNSWKSAWHDAAHILLLNLSESTCTMAHNLQTKEVQHVLTALLCLVSLHLIICAFEHSHKDQLPSRMFYVPHTFTILPAAAALQTCIASQSMHGISRASQLRRTLVMRLANFLGYTFPCDATAFPRDHPRRRR